MIERGVDSHDNLKKRLTDEKIVLTYQMNCKVWWREKEKKEEKSDEQVGEDKRKNDKKIDLSNFITKGDRLE